MALGQSISSKASSAIPKKCSNYSLHVSRKLVSDGTRMRVDLEIMAFIAILSFLVGLSLAVMGVVLA